MYENYVFDLYGTLVDICTEETRKIVWKQMALFYRYSNVVYNWEDLKDRYFEIVNEELKHQKYVNKKQYSHETYPDIKIEKVFEKLYFEKGVEPDSEIVKRTAIHFRRVTTKKLILYKGAKELLELLHNSGKKLYLLSNAQRVFTEWELESLGILEYFDGILISSDEGLRKPDKEFAMLLNSRFGVNFDNTLLIGNDVECDINSAKKVGMDAMYIHSNISPKDDPVPNCKYVLNKMNMKKVREILLQQ